MTAPSCAYLLRMNRKNKGDASPALIRGGQYLLHYSRLCLYLSRYFLGLLGGLFVSVGSLCFIRESDDFGLSVYILMQAFFAKILSLFFNDPILDFSIGAQPSTVLASHFSNLPEVHTRLQALWVALRHASQRACLVTGLAALVLMMGMLWLGTRRQRDRLLRGHALCSSKQLSRQVRQSKQKPIYTFAGVPLPKDSECQHILVCGATGSGKSVAIQALMAQIRAQGACALVFDKGLNLLPRFYQSGDHILDPFDARGARWDLWAECQSVFDYEMIGHALIPEQAAAHNDSFFTRAARNLWIDLLAAHHCLERPDMEQLLKEVFSDTLDRVRQRVAGRSSETLFSEKVEKTALNVLSELSNYLKCLQYLPRCVLKPPFSIRKWVHGVDLSWLFLASEGATHDLLKPLISLWINIACQALLSKNNSKRIFVILDEVASLTTLPALLPILSEGRKFGVSVVLGLQSIGQLAGLYGVGGQTALLGNLNTRLYLRSPEIATAHWVSDNLSQVEIMRPTDHLSYGAKADGVQVTHPTQLQPLVLASAILRLPDLVGYLTLKGDYPPARVVLPYEAPTHPPWQRKTTAIKAATC